MALTVDQTTALRATPPASPIFHLKGSKVKGVAMPKPTMTNLGTSSSVMPGIARSPQMHMRRTPAIGARRKPQAKRGGGYRSIP